VLRIMDSGASEDSGECFGAAGSVAVAAPTPPPAARSADSEQMEDKRLCVVCEGNPPFQDGFRGFPCHRACKAAIRSHRRLLKDEDARRDLDGEFWTDRAAWQARISPLVAMPGQRRTSAQRDMAASPPTHEETFVIRDRVRMTLDMYVAHRTGMRWTEQAAETDFFARVDLQGSDEENTDGEATTMVTLAEVHRTVAGRRPLQPASRSAALAAGALPRARDRSVAGSLARRSATSTGDDVEFPAADAEPAAKHRRTAVGGAPSSPPGGSATPAATLAQAAAGVRGAGGEDKGRSGAKGGAGSRPKPGEAAAKTGGRQVQLLHDKASLERDVKSELEAATNSKAPYTVLKAKSASVPPADLAVLEMSPSHVLEVIEHTIIAPLKAMVTEMPTLALKDVASKRAELDRLKLAIPGCVEPALQLIGALQFWDQQKRHAERKEKMGKRYLLDKHAKFLCDGGCKTVMAKTLATRMAEISDPQAPASSLMLAAGAAIDPHSVCGFASLPPCEDSYTGLLATMLAGAGESIAKKTADMEARMVKKGWACAMARLECPLDALKKASSPFGLGENALMEHQGAAPWLVGVRGYTFKYGPEYFPMPGMACVLCGTGKTLMVAMIPVEHMIAEGISVTDAAAFLESPTGQSFARERMVYIMLPSNGAVWCPFGYVPLLIYGPEGEDKSSIAHVVVLTLWAAKPAADMNDALWKSIASWNSRHMEKLSGERVWAARAELWKQMCDAVADMRARSTT